MSPAGKCHYKGLSVIWTDKIPVAQRFELVLDGEAVLDNETGLVWAKSLISDKFNWCNAVEHCYQLTLGGRKGWRLPSVEELASLVDPTNHAPALPTGHPFININTLEGYYWSSTTYVVENDQALVVHMISGETGYHYPKNDNNFNVWPVRGGHLQI